MRFSVLILLLFSSLTTSYSLNKDEEVGYCYEFTKALENKIDLQADLPVFFDTTLRLSIADVLADPLIYSLQPSLPSGEREVAVWQQITLINSTDSVISGYFSFCGMALEIDHYQINDNKLISHKRSGRAKAPLRKEIITSSNHLLFSIQPGQKNTYYTRSLHKRNTSLKHLQELRLSNLLSSNVFLSQQHIVQSFYSGLMLMLTLLSCFLFMLFRNTLFLYFAAIQFSFAFYFAVFNQLIDSLFPVNISVFFFELSQISISFITLSISFFVMHFIKLSVQLPRYYRFYLFFALIISVLGHFGYFFRPLYFEEFAIFYNLVLVLWAILTIVPLAILSKRRQKEAKNVLLAISILFITGVVYILALSKVIDLNLFSRHAIQIGTIAFSTLVFYGLFNQINSIKNAKNKAEALEQLKSEFFTNISHEFRTPLTLISGPIQEMLESSSSSSDKKLLNLVLRNSQRMQHLINQLLELAKLESKSLQLQPSQINIVPYLKGIVMSFESLANQKNIRIHFTSESDRVPLYIDNEKAEMLFYNLLSNAFKFTPPNGDVSVMVIEKKVGVEIIIRDTGIGISTDKIPFVFDRFFQGKDKNSVAKEGSGVGLAVVKQLVELHKATISVESSLGKGTSFRILFLTENSQLPEKVLPPTTVNTNDYILDPTVLEPEYERPVEEEEKTGKLGTLPRVLVIEDNNDVRSFIKTQLKASFHIIEAIDGQQGINKAIEFKPDLIITDVMMPIKDGYEVIQALKSNRASSHIPIILLTALASDSEKIKGLEYGADDYLTKPFQSKELNVRVKKLIAGRTELKKLIHEVPTLQFSQLKGNPTEIDFMEKVMTCINAHVSKSDFGSEDLAEQLNMSRVHLNRKLKKISDLSSNKFIQQVRLKKALQLIEETNRTVADIAHEVGFNSTAYFVKCFREHYGQTPGTLRPN